MDTEFLVDSVLLDQLNFTNEDVSLTISGTIDTENIQRAISQLLILDKKGLKYIPIVIHSGGGNVDDLLTMIHVRRQLHSKIHITTV